MSIVWGVVPYIKGHLRMVPLLTLIIALGGIATAIGAIWTAVVTRRLVHDQATFRGTDRCS
jgi:hypothetical protein